MPDIFVATSSQDKENKNYQADQIGEGNGLLPTAHVSHLASFFERPDGVSFKNQKGDEKILLFLRKHFITNLGWLFIVFVLVFLPPLISISSSRFSVFAIFDLPPSFTIVLVIFYYLIVFNYFFINFITWFYNISLVTQKRIIDIDFSNLVYHNVAATKLSLVEDVNYTQVGFIRTLFDYGDAVVQTAGEELHFDFLAVPKPGKVVDIVQNLIGRRREHDH